MTFTSDPPGSFATRKPRAFSRGPDRVCTGGRARKTEKQYWKLCARAKVFLTRTRVATRYWPTGSATRYSAHEPRRRTKNQYANRGRPALGFGRVTRAPNRASPLPVRVTKRSTAAFARAKLGVRQMETVGCDPIADLTDETESRFPRSAGEHAADTVSPSTPASRRRQKRYDFSPFAFRSTRSWPQHAAPARTGSENNISIEWRSYVVRIIISRLTDRRVRAFFFFYTFIGNFTMLRNSVLEYLTNTEFPRAKVCYDLGKILCIGIYLWTLKTFFWRFWKTPVILFYRETVNCD